MSVSLGSSTAEHSFYGGKVVARLSSLRFRLLLVSGIVVIVAIGAGALVSSLIITGQFERFVREGGTLGERCFQVIIGPGARVSQEMFLNSVNRSLWSAVLAAGIVAVVLSLTISQRILGPVGELTKAAHRMQSGDLRQRVHVQSQDELGALAQAFNAMADGLAETEDLRRHLINDVAHELRTPLSNVCGYLEAMNDGVTEPTPSIIESLYEEAMLLQRLVEDLQELALAEAGQLKLASQPTAIGDIITKTANAHRTAASEKDIQIVIDLAPGLPAVRADRARISQVLRNLLDNAITHTPPGGQITITARQSGTYVEVSVHDTGSGISYEHLPYVFDRFYRADPSRARATGGAGLGLAIVKQLVEAHGGRAWVRSTVGQGSTFLFTVPITLQQAAPGQTIDPA
mgnify:CR=1 FL=1